MPKYTLIYFNGKGRAESVRLLFAAAGVEYEDRRIQREEWQALKPEVPFGQLPCLEVDGQRIGQSSAMLRFLGRETGMAGKTSMDQALVDSVTDTINDLREKFVPHMFEKDEDKKKAGIKEFLEKTLPEICEKLEAFTKANKSSTGCPFGDSMTYADVHLYACMEGFVNGMGVKLDKFPGVLAVYETVKTNPGVAKWVKDRPETAF